MLINYFSPLLPAQSGISEVAQQVIPALSRYAAVQLWTDQAEWDPELAKYAKICPYRHDTIDLQALQRADLNIYHIGNNVNYHRSIWLVSQQVPGLVVLHDPQLSHFCYGLQMAEPDGPIWYPEAVEAHYGPAAGEMAEEVMNQTRSFDDMTQFSMTNWALARAAAVMVHTQTAFETLSESNRWTIGYQPLAFHAPALSPQTDRQSPPYRLIVFGYIGFNRRIAATLEAISQLEARSRFQLDIYGVLEDPEAIKQQIAQYQLTDQIQMHGFVDDHVLEQALANADLAINLRYPTMGEASISQLRIWRHALPSLVTKVGWYGEQPDDTVCFVHPETEVADIQRHLQALVEQPDQFRQIGQRGRQQLETVHAPEDYAKALISFVEHIKSGYQDPSAQHFLARPSQALGPMQVSNLNPTTFNRLTEAMHWLGGPPATASLDNSDQTDPAAN